MSIQIEKGFRYPLSRFPSLIPTLSTVLTPLGDREAIRIARELCAIAQDSPGLPWEALESLAPRFFRPPIAVTKTTTPQQAAIDLVYYWAEFGRHRSATWSMYDAGIRVDLWTLEGDDADAQYVYGRIVASNPGFHEALLAEDGFEDYSYWQEEDETPEWAQRQMAWHRIKDKNRFEWTYLPHRIPMMDAMKEGWLD